MSRVVGFIRRCQAAGIDMETALRAAEAFEVELAIAVDEALKPLKAASAARTRRYRERGGGAIPAQLRAAVFERDGYTCCECGSKEDLQCDHVHPVSKGGPTTFENLQTLCKPCNARKRDRIRKAEVRGSPTNSADNGGQAADRGGIGRKPADTTPARTHVRDISPRLVISGDVGGGGGEARERASDDWPEGKARDHAKLLVETVASPRLDPSKSPGLVTTMGRLEAWKRDGASWEHDVVPVVTALCAKQRGPVSTWKFFDQAIARSIADNRAALEIPEADARPRAQGPPSLTDRIADEATQARLKAHAMMDAANGR